MLALFIFVCSGYHLLARAAGLTTRLRPAWRYTPVTAADRSTTTGECPDRTKAL
jgi:hypothetical protein